MITPTEWTRFKFEWLEEVMYDPDLSPGAKVVAFCILQHCNMGTESGYPSLRRIAELTKLRKASVIDAVALLEANGHLDIHHGRPGRGQSHYYTPTLKATETGPLNPEPLRNVTRDVTRNVSTKGTKSVPQRYEKRTSKGTETGPLEVRKPDQNTLIEHLNGTPEYNQVRSATELDEKQVWNEEEEAAQRRDQSSQQPPTAGMAGRGSPEGTVSNVIPIASPPTVPRPPPPSRPRKLGPEEQENRDIRKSAVWRDCADGRITEVEAGRRVAAIDAAPPEA
jgi:hypothetical protein